jgi:hypothetical protein
MRYARFKTTEFGVGMASSAKRDILDPRVASIGAIRKTNPGPSLDRGVQAQIGDKLRAMYGELQEQPLPDRLSQILDRLGQESKA